MCAPPSIVPVGPGVRNFFIYSGRALVWFGAPAPRRESSKGGGIRDARVKDTRLILEALSLLESRP